MQKKLTTQEEIENMRQELAREKQKLTEKNGIKVKSRTGFRLGKTAGQIFFALIVLLLLTALISVQVQLYRGEIPSLFGFQLLRVESGSMEPTLRVGSVILTRELSGAGSLQIGDIVTFRTTSGAVVTHRIIETATENGGTAYRTKGDNPVNSPDPELLTPDRVIAAFVLKIPLT